MADEATRVEMTGTREAVHLTRAEFDALPEYSLSIPTGTTIGKRWKRDENAVVRLRDPQRRSEAPSWVVGEYYDTGDPAQVGIRWTPIEVEEATPVQPSTAKLAGLPLSEAAAEVLGREVRAACDAAALMGRAQLLLELIAAPCPHGCVGRCPYTRQLEALAAKLEATRG